MKKITATLCLLCGLFTATRAQTEAVGINTENPKGVLHIDAASTTVTTNPLTGEVSPAQAADDVVIDALGQVGVGVSAPQAKLHISSNTPGGAIRIADGTQGYRKVLVSLDDEGTASWADIPGSWWYAALDASVEVAYSNAFDTPVFSQYSNEMKSSGEGSLSRQAGTITVPYTGRYRIIINIHCNARRTAPYKVMAILRVNGSPRWTPSVWGTTWGYGTQATWSTILELDEDDVLSVAFDRTQSYSINLASARLFAVEFIQQ
jgi:hypothetical protein